MEDNSQPVTHRVNELVQNERSYGLDDLATYARFESKCEAIRYALLEFLIDAKRSGKHVAGYGAPGKGNTLLNYCGIRKDLVQYTVDRSPYKQNMLLPGTHIPVFAPDMLRQTQPDYVLILPWNLKTEVMEQTAYIREWGGRFVVPIPSIQVLE
jgi:hypothetical protein